eukprot:gene55317-12422_t
MIADEVLQAMRTAGKGRGGPDPGLHPSLQLPQPTAP